MKKALFLLCILFVLVGCNRNADEISEEKLAMYSSYYQAVLNNTEFEEFSRYFSITSEVTEANGGYLYYLTIDNPQIAMYDVELIVLEGLVDMANQDMVPSLGLFEDEVYNMIPYQVNAEKGYVKGLTVSGDVSDPSLPLYCMVAWKDLGQLNQSREFFEINLDYANQNSGQIHEVEDDSADGAEGE